MAYCLLKLPWQPETQFTGCQVIISVSETLFFIQEAKAENRASPVFHNRGQKRFSMTFGNL